ncbi:hypothetical protein B0G62_105224 [Paraburkholderia eburnea]|uniref:Beta-lactamase-related domain-containing protein n=1 Tax=Paraburkholderia eburnea TaxID=1189126 RepID=A0A2S4MBZ2_9BURK|nr:serine hydrolase [Paraburkholderia eburnea]POR52256.1 hypothetical protein B0G62_105224 [Paraburkholderia eburnea]PRZ23147.1 hypothetical protein BX588_105224 [Paraburkholderia eburnea]
MNLRKSANASPRLRAAVAMLVAVLLTPAAYSQEAPAPVDAGVMQGFPPPPDKLVTKTNLFQASNLRWALQNARMTMPTANVEHAREPMPLPNGTLLDPDKVQFTVDGTTVDLTDYLRQTRTDGFIVVHNGKVVLERYFNTYSPHQTHGWASMTKSVTGLIAAQLIGEGKLDPEAKLSTYVPELAGTPFGDATLQQNLDMEVPVTYPAALPPDLGLFAAVGFIPRRPGAPDNIYDFLKVARATPNETAGDIWFYQNGSPEAVAWAMRRVTGQSWSELVSRSIWQKIAEDDGDAVVDRMGAEMASGGFSSTLRDAARFGELMRLSAGGNSRFFPASVTRVALKQADNAAGFAKSRLGPGRPGYTYHDYWYQVNDGDGSFSAGGRFGQSILVNPKNGLTIVKFSSYPDAAPRPVSAVSGQAGAQTESAASPSPLLSAAALNAAAKAIASAVN